jgi:hypothetical protein
VLIVGAAGRKHVHTERHRPFGILALVAGIQAIKIKHWGQPFIYDLVLTVGITVTYSVRLPGASRLAAILSVEGARDGRLRWSEAEPQEWAWYASERCRRV